MDNDQRPDTVIDQANSTESALYGLANYSFWWLAVAAVLVMLGLCLPYIVFSSECSDLLWGLPYCRERLFLGADPNGLEIILVVAWLGYLIAAGDQLAERYLGVVAMKSYGRQMLRPAQIVATFFAVIAVVGLGIHLTSETIPSLDIFIVILVGSLLAGLPMDNKQQRSDLSPLWAKSGLYFNAVIVSLMVLSSASGYLQTAWLSSL